MGGAIILLVGMFIVGPIGLFLVGAIWSGLTGWFLATDAAERSQPQDTATG